MAAAIITNWGYSAKNQVVNSVVSSGHGRKAESISNDTMDVKVPLLAGASQLPNSDQQPQPLQARCVPRENRRL